VRPDAMRRVLDASGGLIVAEAVMMGLAPRIGRQVAHDVVYDCCREALSGAASFADALKADERVSAHLGPDEIDRLVDPANYLGAAGDMTVRLLKRRRR